jgi:hypothetical protein
VNLSELGRPHTLRIRAQRTISSCKLCRERRPPLNGILGGGEVMETADDRAEHLRREFAQQMLGTGV